MANTPGSNPQGPYGGPQSPVAQIDLASFASPLTAAIDELRKSLDQHRAAVEELAKRLGATTPAKGPVDGQLVSDFEQLKKTLGAAISK